MHALIGGSLFVIVGVQLVGMGLCALAYTAYFMAFLDDQAEALHDRLIKGDVSGEAYRETFKVLERAKSQARTIVAAGEASQELLLEWGKDGTISEANAWIADHPGAVNGGV
jgi:hypothetical protein